MASIEERFLLFAESSGVDDRNAVVRSFALTVLRDDAVSDSDLRFIIDICARPGVCDDELALEFVALILDDQRHTDVRIGAVLVLNESLEGVDYDFPEYEPLISQPVYDTIVRHLGGLMDDEGAPADLRQTAMEVWASNHHLPEETRASVVRSAWARSDRDWKLAAARCMRFLHGCDVEVLQAIASQDVPVRAAGIIAAGQRGYVAAWPYVREILLSPSTRRELLLAALHGAWNIKPDEAQPLIALHTTSPDLEIAATAVQSLEMAVSASFTLDLAHEKMVEASGKGFGRETKTRLMN